MRLPPMASWPLGWFLTYVVITAFLLTWGLMKVVGWLADL